MAWFWHPCHVFLLLTLATDIAWKDPARAGSKDLGFDTQVMRFILLTYFCRCSASTGDPSGLSSNTLHRIERQPSSSESKPPFSLQSKFTHILPKPNRRSQERVQIEAFPVNSQAQSKATHTHSLAQSKEGQRRMNRTSPWHRSKKSFLFLIFTFYLSFNLVVIVN